MEALYHDFCPVAIPCSRNLPAARQIHEDNAVMIKLNDTRRVAGYAWLPLSDYVRRYNSTGSRLRSR